MKEKSFSKNLRIGRFLTRFSWSNTLWWTSSGDGIVHSSLINLSFLKVDDIKAIEFDLLWFRVVTSWFFGPPYFDWPEFFKWLEWLVMVFAYVILVNHFGSISRLLFLWAGVSCIYRGLCMFQSYINKKHEKVPIDISTK